MARPQRLPGPGAQTLHPARLSRLRLRRPSSSLHALLHPTATPALHVCASAPGGADQASTEKRTANRRVALPDGTSLNLGAPPKPCRHEDFKTARYLNKIRRLHEKNRKRKLVALGVSPAQRRRRDSLWPLRGQGRRDACP